MKFLNKIAIVTFATTLMVAQAQAIELVKVEPVAKFSVTQAAQKSLSDSMKLKINTTSVKVVIDAPTAKLNNLNFKPTQSLAKTILIAE